MAKYSVLVPAYNVENYICECVESVINQSYDFNLFEDVEIIIANDGSTDSTGDVCDKLEKKYPNIKVFHKENEGQLLTREFLLQKALSEYVLYLDADDKWEVCMLKILDENIERFGRPDIISFGFNLWEGQDFKPYNKINEQFYCEEGNFEKAWILLLCEDTYNSLWSKAIKRDVLLKSRVEQSLRNIRRGEDKLQLISCFENAKNILFIPDRLYDYRINNASITRLFKPNYFCEIISVDEFVFGKIKKKTLYDEAYRIRWGENLVEKFVDYVVSAFSSLPKKEAEIYISGFASSDTMRKAVFYAKKSKKLKMKVKSYLVFLKLYYMLLFLHKVN